MHSWWWWCLTWTVGRECRASDRITSITFLSHSTLVAYPLHNWLLKFIWTSANSDFHKHTEPNTVPVASPLDGGVIMTAHSNITCHIAWMSMCINCLQTIFIYPHPLIPIFRSYFNIASNPRNATYRSFNGQRILVFVYWFKCVCFRKASDIHKWRGGEVKRGAHML